MENNCLTCGKIIGKNNKFCSNSCSAKYNNSKRKKNNWVSPKRNSDNYCKICNKYCRSSYSGFCRNHWMEDTNKKRGLLTKIQLTMIHYSSSNKYQLIRNHAKDFLKIKNVKKECNVCGYTAHVESCHIIPIEKFSDDTLVCEINSLNNLVYLCSNHHWELDNGILNLAGMVSMVAQDSSKVQE